MPADLPPDIPLTPPSGYVAPAPACHYLSNTEAQVAFARLRQRLSGTAFDNARPSEICGLVRVQLASGKTVYTDATGRYLLLTFALDTHRGEPADNSEKLEEAITDREAYPNVSIPNVFPPPAE